MSFLSYSSHNESLLTNSKEKHQVSVIRTGSASIHTHGGKGYERDAPSPNNYHGGYSGTRY